MDHLFGILFFLTPSRQEYLYELGYYSNQLQTVKFLANQIESVVNRIGSQKILAIVSNNGANIVSARRLICSKFKKYYKY